MSLAAVRRGKLATPLKVLLYGVEGIGKSTFGAGAPSPIFLCAEDRTAHLDVDRLPQPESWEDVTDALRVIAEEKHAYETLVVDTLDWIEPLCWSYVSSAHGHKGIEDFGYGKGYNAALDEWRRFLAGLERVRARGMNIILLAHSLVRPFKNPEGPDFDRYTLALHEKAGGLFKQWVDEVLFAQFETFTQVDKQTKRVRGADSGARLIYTQRRAAYDAKNSHDLPESLPLDWDTFYEAARAHRPADPAVLRAAIAEKLAASGDVLSLEVKAKVAAAVERAGDDAAVLARINTKVNGLIEAPKGE